VLRVKDDRRRRWSNPQAERARTRSRMASAATAVVTIDVHLTKGNLSTACGPILNPSCFGVGDATATLLFSVIAAMANATNRRPDF